MMQRIHSSPFVCFFFGSTFLLLASSCTTHVSTIEDGSLPLNLSQEVSLEQQKEAEALAWFSEALLLDQQGDTEAALAAYQKAMELDPSNEALYMDATGRLIQAGRIEDAFTVLDQLLNRNPANAQALRWKARLYRQQQDLEQSLEFYEQALALFPAEDVIYLEAIQTALQAGQGQRSVQFAKQGAHHMVSERILEIYFQMLEAEKQNAADLRSIDSLEEEGLLLLETSRTRFPEYSPFQYLYAEHQIEAGNLQEAFRTYGDIDAASGDPDEERARILVHLLDQLGCGRQAARTFRSRLKDEDLGSLAWYLNGLLWEIQENPQQARTAYEAARDLDPSDSPTLRKLAVALYQEGSSLEALTLLETVLEKEPDHPEVLLLSGRIALASGLSTRAAAYLEQRLALVARGVDLEEAPLVHGQLAMALWNAQADLSQIEDQLVLAGQEPGILEMVWRHCARSIFLKREKEPNDAQRMEEELLQTLENVSDRLPLNPEPFWLIASSHRLQKNYSLVLEALMDYEQIAQHMPDPELWLNVEYQFDVAAALERTGKREQAIQTFEQIIAEEPNHHPSLNYVAYMWAEESENLELALEYVRRAMQLDPDNGSYIDTLGWIYFMQEKFEDAYRELLRSAELIPEESVVAEHLGDVLMKLDRPVEARGYYLIALELDPAERLDQVRASLAEAEQAVADLLAGD